MNDPSTQLCLGQDSGPVPIPRIVARAYLWLVGAAGVFGMLIFAVATQSSLDAERIAGATGGYAETLIGAMAASQGRRIP